MINELTINQIHGLFNQMYNLEECLFDTLITDNFFDVNALFWSQIFNINNIRKMIKELDQRDSIQSTKLLAVKNNPIYFINSFIEAINNINSQSLDEKTFFKYLETLQIVCHLHTYLYTLPFELTIFEGYKHNQFSAKQLKRDCLLQYYNPYYLFIKETLIPQINYKNLKILWIKGRPNISGFCIARMIKEKNPDVFIVLHDNNTEFFSFYKIIPNLKHNHEFFSVFDCIVLNDNSNTYAEIRNSINQNKDLNGIDNIIYSPDKGNTIMCTKRSKLPIESFEVSTKEIKMKKIINLKLFPNNACYWDKCSFCAINKKYLSTENCWDFDYVTNQLKYLKQLGLNKFWALDEAIPAKELQKLCELIKQQNLKFTWHVRTRIEKEILLNNLPQKLFEAGLKHILFGFESASNRILNLMNKTDKVDIYLILSEKIVQVFNDLKIFIHFPVIIGFPTESQKERNETFKFLNYLRNKYPYFSYNINILNLDIASTLYKHWEKYNITAIEYPCPPYDFIGNSILWKSITNSIDTKSLEEQSMSQMKTQFDWYPKDALIDINSFYTMWEYSRNQLNLSQHNQEDIINDITPFTLEQQFIINPKISLFQDEEKLYCLYNFDNHQCIRGGKLIYDIINEIILRSNITNFMKNCDKSLYNSILQFVSDLKKYNFIQPIIL